jgi:hypothetical protein
MLLSVLAVQAQVSNPKGGPHKHVPKASPSAPASENRWVVTVRASALDNKKLTILDLQTGSDELVIRCSDEKIEGFVIPKVKGILSYDELHQQAVRFKLDSGPVQTGQWDVSDDAEAIFMPISVLRQLPNGTLLTVEFHPYQLLPQTVQIPLFDLAKHFNQATGECGFPAPAEDHTIVQTVVVK